MTTANSGPLRTLGIGSTLLDAAFQFARGHKKSAAVLVGAAALSTRVPGLGVAASVLLRVFRRLR